MHIAFMALFRVQPFPIPNTHTHTVYMWLLGYVRSMPRNERSQTWPVTGKRAKTVTDTQLRRDKRATLLRCKGYASNEAHKGKGVAIYSH